MRITVLGVLVGAGLVVGCGNDPSKTGGSGGSSVGSNDLPGSNTKAGSNDTKPVTTPTRSDWAAGHPASVTQDMIDAVNEIEAVFTAQSADMVSVDCTKEATAIRALIPATKRASAIAEQADALSQKDPDAKKWLDATYTPHVKGVFGGIVAAIKSTQCKGIPEWVEATKAWAGSTGATPPR